MMNRPLLYRFTGTALACVCCLVSVALGRVDAARADSSTHELMGAPQDSERKEEHRQEILCWPSEYNYEWSSEYNYEESDFNVTEFDSDYWRQGYKECVLAADLNGKLDSEFEWKVLPSDPLAQHMQELKDCLSKAFFKRGGFLGIGGTKKKCWDSLKPGFQLQPECMKQLCECNKELLKDGVHLECSWSLKKLDCEEVKKAAKEGGAALINVGDPDDLKLPGHTVQALDVECDDEGNLTKVKFRDPANPDVETEATVCAPPCNRWDSNDTRYNGMVAEGYYSIQSGNNK